MASEIYRAACVQGDQPSTLMSYYGNTTALCRTIYQWILEGAPND